MGRVLLVDTNFSSAPIYQYLIREGYEVYVAGNNPNDCLAKQAENYINVDYSDIKKFRQIISQIGVNYIVPGCNDKSYYACSMLSNGEFPGVDSLESTQILNDKRFFREFSNKINLPSPKILSMDEARKTLPIIVKPVDAYSGRGITVIDKDNVVGLDFAISKAIDCSPSRSIIVEECVTGILYSHSSFIMNQEVIFDFVVEEHCTANPYAVDTSRIAHDFSESTREELRRNVHVIAKALKLHDGLFHMQFIKKGNIYWIVEVTRRCPGDLYSTLIELSTGVDYVENYVSPFLGREFKLSQSKTSPDWIMRHTISRPINHVVGGLKFKIPIQIEFYVSLSTVGDSLMPAPQGRVGIIFTKSSSTKDLESLFRIALCRNLYEFR